MKSPVLSLLRLLRLSATSLVFGLLVFACSGNGGGSDIAEPSGADADASDGDITDGDMTDADDNDGDHDGDAEAGCAIQSSDSIPRLDPEFGVCGIMKSRYGSGITRAKSVAVDAEGWLYVAGSRQPEEGDAFLFIQRLSQDGTLDDTFGSENGLVLPFSAEYGQSFALTVQPDGKVVAAGVEGSGRLIVSRFNLDGTLDSHFAEEGVFILPAQTDLVRFVSSVLVRSDDDLLLVGGINNAGSILVGLTPNGTLDETFGEGGVVVSDATRSCSGALLQVDGKIVTVSSKATGEPIPPSNYALARYNPDGSLDTAFGEDGVGVAIGPSTGGEGLSNPAEQQDGKLIASGNAWSDDFSDLRDATVVRFTVDGQPDSGYGEGGVLKFDLGQTGGMTALILDDKDRALVAGSFSTTFGDPAFDFLVRLDPGSEFDESFGENGVFTSDFRILGLATQPDGKLIVVGVEASDQRVVIGEDEGDEMVVARYIVE